MQKEVACFKPCFSISTLYCRYRKFSESTDGDQVDGQPLPMPSPPQPIKKTTIAKETTKSVVVRKAKIDPEAEKRKIDSVLFLQGSADQKLSDYRKLYADMLMRCELHMKSAEILKKAEQIEDSPPIFPYAKTCVKCANTFSGRKCFKCDVSNDSCVICDLRIRGLSAYCMNCGHGGHYKHVKSYFQEGPRPCPSGCGCNCILSMFN